jgi:RNA polymerase sigma-70 factor, ECF subfamily
MKVFRSTPHLADVRCAQDMRQDSPLGLDDDGEQTETSGLPLDFTAVYDRYFHEVLRWIRAFGGPEADMEDLAQEVFVVVRRKLARFDGANLPGWLYGIAKLTVRDHGRRAWFRRIFRGRRNVEFDELACESDDPEALMLARENRRLFYRLVGQMSERRRETFILFEVEGMTCEEIARLQGVPVGTVWTRLHHARKDFIAKVKALLPEKAGQP